MRMFRLLNAVPTPESQALGKFKEQLEARPGGIDHPTGAALLGAELIADNLPVDGVQGATNAERAVFYLQQCGVHPDIVAQARKAMEP